MKIFLYEALLIASVGWPSPAQERAPTVIERARSMDKLSHSFVERVGIIVEEGSRVMPLLESELQNGRIDRFVLAPLGFLATERDADVLRRLGEVVAQSGESNRLEAIDALIRIGGRAIEELLGRLSDSQASPELASSIVDRVWLSPRPVDLLRMKEVFESLASTHPNAAVRKLVSEYGLARVSLAYRVLEEGTGADRFSLLGNVLQGREGAFVTVTGGVAVCWAADQLVDLGAPSAATEIRSYLQGKEARGVELETTSKKRLLLAIERSNTALNADETAWLASVRELDPRTLTPAVDAAQLMRWLAEIRKERESEGEGK